MPPNTVYVGRPTKWGNPYTEGDGAARKLDFELDRLVVGASPTRREIINELRGRNLACWCPLDQPCHADVLLKLANE